MSKLIEIFTEVENEDSVFVSAEEVSLELDEAIVSYEDVSLAEDVVEEFAMIAEGLESIHDRISDDFKDGVLTGRELSFVNMAIEAHVGRIGLEKEATVSVESFSQYDQIQVSNEALDKVKETLSKIWNAIKKAILKVIEVVRNFFARVFSAVERVIQRVDSINKYIKENDIVKKEGELGTSIKDKEISAPAAKFLTYNGSINSKGVESGLKALKDVIDACYGPYAEQVRKFYDGGSDLASLVASAKNKEEVSKIADEIRSLSEDTFGKPGLIPDVEVLGGVHFNLPSKTKEGKPNVIPTLSGENVSTDGKGKILSTRDMATTLKLVKETASMIKAKKSVIESIEKARKENIKRADKLTADLERSKLSFLRGGEVRSLMNHFRKNVNSPINQITAHAMKCMKASLAYVSVSISTIEKEYKKK